MQFPYTLHCDLLIHVVRHELDANLAWHNAAGVVGVFFSIIDPCQPMPPLPGEENMRKLLKPVLGPSDKL